MRILVCEPDRGADALTAALREMTRRGHTVQWRPTDADLEQYTSGGDPDVCLVDSALGEESIEQLMRVLPSTLPCVYLSEGRDPEGDAAAIRAGAAVVLIRHTLEPDRLENVLRRVVDGELRVDASYRGDGLDLADVELLHERLELALASASRGGRGIAVLALQLHGPQGEALPARNATAVGAEAAARIRRCLRRVDTVASVGPLQYLVLLERLESGPFAVHVADRLLAEIRKPFHGGSSDVPVTASIGISVYPDDGQQPDDLVSCANAALRAARAGGGDLFGFYSGPMNEAASRRVALERSLLEALQRGEFEVHYQPQIDIRDGRLAGMESLLRWTTRRHGTVSPVEFVPLLEAKGLIDKVGAWALERACAQAREWAERGLPVRMGVNVSAKQLRSERFVDTVAHALHTTGLDPTLLEIELTEGVLVENHGIARNVLAALRQRGVRVAIDDFGTGYASLSYVRRFPMDTLKIDREFVRDLPEDPQNVAITSAIAALAESLDLHTVAEGVEKESEEQFLYAKECYIIQGFRHAYPMSANDFEHWYRNRS
jgi:EAL domain-containing protein (putative c-di-GMP-specific phosphodiesterase class I)/GGDEF domain-containing protein